VSQPQTRVLQAESTIVSNGVFSIGESTSP